MCDGSSSFFPFVVSLWDEDVSWWLVQRRGASLFTGVVGERSSLAGSFLGGKEGGGVVVGRLVGTVGRLGGRGGTVVLNRCCRGNRVRSVTSCINSDLTLTR